MDVRLLDAIGVYQLSDRAMVDSKSHRCPYQKENANYAHATGNSFCNILASLQLWNQIEWMLQILLRQVSRHGVEMRSKRGVSWQLGSDWAISVLLLG